MAIQYLGARDVCPQCGATINANQAMCADCAAKRQHRQPAALTVAIIALSALIVLLAVLLLRHFLI